MSSGSRTAPCHCSFNAPCAIDTVPSWPAATCRCRKLRCSSVCRCQLRANHEHTESHFVMQAGQIFALESNHIKGVVSLGVGKMKGMA